MADEEQILRTIRENGYNIWMSGPQPESAIRELEQALGVALPPTYRAFLLQYGSMAISDTFLSGIHGADPLTEFGGGMYSDTLRFRSDYRLPEHFLVVESDEDAPYCLDTRTVDEEGEMPVVCYELHSGCDGRIAKNFGAFFTDWYLAPWVSEKDEE